MAEGHSFWTWRTGGPSLAERGRGRPTLPRISMPPPDPSPALSRSYDDDSPQLRRRSQPNTPSADHDRRNSSSPSISSSDRPLPPLATPRVRPRDNDTSPAQLFAARRHVTRYAMVLPRLWMYRPALLAIPLREEKKRRRVVMVAAPTCCCCCCTLLAALLGAMLLFAGIVMAAFYSQSQHALSFTSTARPWTSPITSAPLLGQATTRPPINASDLTTILINLNVGDLNFTIPTDPNSPAYRALVDMFGDSMAALLSSLYNSTVHYITTDGNGTVINARLQFQTSELQAILGANFTTEDLYAYILSGIGRARSLNIPIFSTSTGPTVTSLQQIPTKQPETLTVTTTAELAIPWLNDYFNLSSIASQELIARYIKSIQLEIGGVLINVTVTSIGNGSVNLTADVTAYRDIMEDLVKQDVGFVPTPDNIADWLRRKIVQGLHENLGVDVIYISTDGEGKSGSDYLAPEGSGSADSVNNGMADNEGFKV